MRCAGLKFTVFPAGQKITLAENLSASLNGNSPGYFDAMGMNIVAGHGYAGIQASHTKPITVVVTRLLLGAFSLR